MVHGARSIPRLLRQKLLLGLLELQLLGWELVGGSLCKVSHGSGRLELLGSRQRLLTLLEWLLLEWRLCLSDWGHLLWRMLLCNVLERLLRWLELLLLLLSEARVVKHSWAVLLLLVLLLLLRWQRAVNGRLLLKLLTRELLLGLRR